MAASLHLAHHAPRHVPRMLGRMRRGWREVETAPGLAAARLFCLAVIDPLFGGTPTPTRWGLLCAWSDGAARDAFLARGDPLRGLLLGARESCHLSLETVRTKDSWHGWSVPKGAARPLSADEPVLVMTHAMLRPRHHFRFTWHNGRIARAQRGAPGLVTRLGLADSPWTRATLSLWRTEHDAVAFAYRSAPHAEIQQRARRTPWADDFFFARFRPVAASGTWHGREPLAGLSAN